MNNDGPEASRQTFSDAKASVCFAAIFWAFIYAVLSLRSGLAIGQEPDLWSVKRAMTTGIGAMVYLAVLVQIVDSPDLSRDRRLKLTLALTLPAAGLVLFARILFEMFLRDGEVAVASELRWTVVWTGYFAASIAAYMVYGYHRQFQKIEQQTDTNNRPDTNRPRTYPSFWAQSRGISVRFAPASIERFEAEGNYIRIHAIDGSTGFLRLALRRLVEDLDPDEFIQVHRSTICRTSEIQALKRHYGGTISIVLASGAEVAVGRTFSKAVLHQCSRTRFEHQLA